MKNIQPSTPNIQYRTKARTHHHWMLVVKCWLSNVPRSILIFGIRLYRWTVSPLLSFLFGPMGGCRFTPSCSQYAMDAIGSQGALAGGWRAAKRICRCHPWGDCGDDPAPGKEFGIRPSALRFDAADVEACRTGARGKSGNSEFGI